MRRIYAREIKRAREEAKRYREMARKLSVAHHKTRVRVARAVRRLRRDLARQAYATGMREAYLTAKIAAMRAALARYRAREADIEHNVRTLVNLAKNAARTLYVLRQAAKELDRAVKAASAEAVK